MVVRAGGFDQADIKYTLMLMLRKLVRAAAVGVVAVVVAAYACFAVSIAIAMLRGSRTFAPGTYFSVIGGTKSVGLCALAIFTVAFLVQLGLAARTRAKK
jgi:hypothetical protein